MNAPFLPNWARRGLHLLAIMAILAVALGAPVPVRAAVPTNDDFDTPTYIPSAPATLTMSDTDFNQATVAVDDPLVCGSNSQGLYTVWYSFIPTAYGRATIDTFGSAFDTVLGIWTGSRGSLQEVACNDDSFIAGNLYQSKVEVSFRPGVHYYIEVTQFVTSVGPAKTYAPQAIDASATWLTLNLQFSASPNVATPGMYDNKSSLWAYVGGWSLVNNTKYYQGSIQRSARINDTATLAFDGNQFTLYFAKALTFGKMEVRVDDVLLDTINQYSVSALYQQTYISPLLTSGVHILQLKNIYKYNNVDAILVSGPPDLIPPAPVTDLAATASASYGAVILNWTATGDDGSDGLAKSYQVRYSTSAILNETDWSNATAVASGVPAPHIPGSAETMTVTGLTPGLVYFFAIRVLDESNVSAVGNSPSAQAAFAGPPAGDGIYDNPNPNWMYFGTWSVGSSLNAYGHSFRVSTKIGNSAAFVFNGTKFILIHGMDRYHGNLDIYVDDVFVTRLNQYNPAQKWQQKYTSPAFAFAQHTVKFVHATGTKVDVDAIQIIGAADTDPPAAVTNLTAVTHPTFNGSINLTWTAPDEDSISPTGKPVTYYLVRYSLTDITDEAAWNAATPVASGIPATPKAPGQAESMTVTGLTPGLVYFIAMRGADEFDNLGGIVSASARAKSPVPAPAGTYDNRDARFLYTSWSLLTMQSGAYQSTVQYSSVIGKTATFVFTGTDFSLIYTRDAIYGVLEVWVDGVLVGTITQTGTKIPQQTWNYSAVIGAPLAAGQHTVVFRHASGTRVNVDAIQIFP